MPLSPARLRSLLRWFHIGVAVMLGTWIYSPLRADPLATDIVRFALIPLATLTGLWLWKQGRIARAFGGRSRRAWPGQGSIR